MSIVAIVPAYNEEKTIADVVRPLLESGAFTRVLVVSDGSSDRTADVAHAAGADVLTLFPNRRKGGAMLAGVQATQGDQVAFFDADLIGLTADHVRQLVAAAADPGVSMVCGLRDYGDVWNRLQVALPEITGERVVRRSVLECVPLEFWSGFRIEAAINVCAKRQGRTEKIVMRGLKMVPKWHKVGPKRGIEDAARMMVEVVQALAQAERIP